ncbi:TAXI family TRAP transporter solute-binding subunit [Tistrella mobilis]
MVARPAGVLAAAIAIAIAVTTPARAEPPPLPDPVAITAYDTGTAGFNSVVAIAKALEDAGGTTVRVLAAGNDLSRLGPVRSGRAVASGMGGGVYFAQEGVFEFANPDWGPQKVRVMAGTTGCNGGHLAVAADTGVRTMADLAGRRIGFVVGAPALNQNTLGLLAFAGLSAADVRIVEFSSYNAMAEGLLNDEVDAIFSVTIARSARELEASPRGLVWPPLPHADAAGWERLLARAPYYTRTRASCGAGGLSPDQPMEMGVYPYPMLTTYADQPPAVIHALTARIFAGYEAYKDAAPGAAGYAAHLQNLTWAVPYHDGAIAAYRDLGLWSDAAQSWNDRLIARQEALAAAWAGYAAGTDATGEAFAAGWLAARAEALAAGGFTDGLGR